MKKINNKGFLLVETLVVSTFIMTVIVILFLQFKSLIVNYNNSFNYNTVEGIYSLNSVKKYINQNYYEQSKRSKLNLDNKDYVILADTTPDEIECPTEEYSFCPSLISKGNFKTIYYANEGIKNKKDNISQGMQNFIKQLDFDTNNTRLIAEFDNGTFASIAYDTSNIVDQRLPKIKSWYSNATTDFHSSEYKPNITSVIFEDSINIPNGATSWDVSATSNSKAVMAWVTADPSDSSKYILHIGGNGGVIANTNSSYIFQKFTNLKSINFGNNYDTSKVTNMSDMFYGCSSLTSLNVSSFDTSKVTNMSHMFRGCSNLNSLDLGDKFDTSNVTGMNHMFYGCSSLISLDLGNNFDTSSVTNMGSMFYGCSKLTSLDLGDKFDTSSVTLMSSMFYGCSKLTSLDLGDKFNTSSVTLMSSMFQGCSSLTSLDLSNFNTSEVFNMKSMFQGCSNLTTIFASNKFDTSSVTNSTSMFSSATKLVGGNGTAVATKKVYDKTYAKIDKSGQEGYFTQKP